MDTGTTGSVDAMATVTDTRPTPGPDGAVIPSTEVCPAGSAAGAPFTGTAPRATKVKDGFNFLEGPVWVASQNALYFSDMNFGSSPAGPASRIHKLTPPNTIDMAWMPMSGSNGLALYTDGRLIACTHDTQRLSLIDPVTKARVDLAGASMYLGKPFNSPNDVTVRADGNVYFSDPDWQRAGRAGQDKQRVYRLSPAGVLSVVEETRSKPNGVALSPDGRTLYVGAIDGAVKKHAVDATGATEPAQNFVQVSGPDGMAVDCAGNLYVTGGGGVHVFTPAGQKLGVIEGTGGGASNAAFGDADRRTLYITNENALYSVRLQIPGYPY
jgi:gluconolactonase